MTIFLERPVLSVIGVFVTIVAVTSPLEMNWWLTTFGTIALLALAGCAALVAKKFIRARVSDRKLQPESPAARSDRVYEDARPSVVTGTYKPHTDPLGSRHLKAMYAGKWARVVGTVAGVDKGDRDGISVYLEQEQMVVLQFDETWLDRVAHLERGSKNSAIGRIDFVSTASLVLRDCELVPTSD